MEPGAAYDARPGAMTRAPQAFSSRHPNGAEFGFCDGSVRFFRNGSDPNTIRYLAGREDGVIVSPDF